jgi:hypothetical protein
MKLIIACFTQLLDPNSVILFHFFLLTSNGPTPVSPHLLTLKI